MEKKEDKLTQKNQETESRDYLSNEGHKQASADHIRKNSKADSPAHDTVSSSAAQQYIPTLHWPYTPQTTIEQQLNRQLPDAQQSLQAVISERQAPFKTVQQPQQNLINHHLQHGQSQATPYGAFWLPPRPGHQAARAPYQPPFIPSGTTDTSWQAPVVVGGASAGSEPISTYCYQGGYSYPAGFPGPWYPSSPWGQPQVPYTLHYPACAGGYGCFSLPLPSSDSSPFGQSHQRGILQLHAKLSQKHQRIWEAQSAENFHLRTALGHVEAEISACRSRLAKLEADVSSLKAQRDSAVEGSMGPGAAPPVQTTRRGRLKRPIATISSLPFTDDLQPKPRGRKPASGKVESETKGLSSEKENSNKEEDKAKTCQPMLGIGPTHIQSEDDGKISNAFVNGCTTELNGNKLELSPDIQALPTFQNHTHHHSPRVQITPVILNPATEMKSHDDKEENRKTAFSIPSQHIKVADAAGTSNGKYGWQSNMLPEGYGRSMSDIRSHSFFDSTSIIRQGRKIFSGWSFMSQDPSEDHEGAVGSAKDDDEMEENVSSAADDMSQDKTESGFGTDPSAVVSNALPQLNRW